MANTMWAAALLVAVVACSTANATTVKAALQRGDLLDDGKFRILDLHFDPATAFLEEGPPEAQFSNSKVRKGAAAFNSDLSKWITSEVWVLFLRWVQPLGALASRVNQLLPWLTPHYHPS
jgi:hypothetical protein